MIYLKYLSKAGHDAIHVDNGGAGLIHIKDNLPPLVLLDLELPDIPGMSILKYISENQLPCTVIIITGHGSIDIAVNAMQSGAFDFLTKPFNADQFNQTVTNALAHQTLNQKLRAHKENFKLQHYNGFIGASPSMQHVYQMIDNVAISMVTNPAVMTARNFPNAICHRATGATSSVSRVWRSFSPAVISSAGYSPPANVRIISMYGRIIPMNRPACFA